VLTSSNVVVQTDGGLREGDCAAAAWVIGLWGMCGGRLQYEPVMVQGTFLEPGISVFAAEATALDEASREVDKLLTSSAK